MTKVRRLSLLAGAALVGALATSPAFAVHDDNLFELDTGAICTDNQGNSSPCGAANVKDDAVAGDDWANIYSGPNSAKTKTFIEDPVGSAEASFFDIGGSKDEEAISTSLGANKSWLYDNNNDVVPDKDDISHAFAAAYTAPNGDKIFYFGADRFDTNGDAQMGFWFFRSPVTLGTKPNFVGQHSVGDILVLSDFHQGGKVGQITVYQVTSVDAKGVPTLSLVTDKGEADCAVVGPSDPVCGVINNLPGEAPPWSYTNKDGQSAYQKGALLEGGINLTKLGLEFGCFSSFLAETRSSHELSAQLKDFALGKFEVCALDVKKEGDILSKVSDPADYTITITNTGQQTLYKKTISDTVLGTITTNGVDQANSNVLSNTCSASLAPGASCVVTLRRTVQAGDPDPLTNTASVVYTEKADFSGVALSKTSNHDVNLFQPSITLTKSATPTALLQGGTVNYTVKLTNTSSTDTPLLNCTITDAALGINQQVTNLGPNADYTLTPSFTFTNPQSLSWCQLNNVGLLECTNTATATCSPQDWPNVLEKTATAKVVVTPARVELTVTKTGPQYAKVGDVVPYTIVITSLSNVPVTITQLTDTVLGNLASYCPPTLAPIGQTGSSCTINVSRTVQAGDPDPLNNTVTVGVQDEFGNTASASASHSVDLVHPDYTVAKSCVSQPVPAGASANFQIKIANSGDIPLLLDILDPAPFTPAVDLKDVQLGVVSGGNCIYDDNPADGCYQIEGGIIATGTEVSNTVDIHATLPDQFKLPNVIDKSANASCTVQQGGASRTPGFWKTHGGLDGYTCHVFDSSNHLAGNANLGWKTLTTCDDALGIFWASAAKNTDGSKRSQLCQATELSSFQLLAALFNQALDNGKAVPIDPKSGLDIIKAEQNALSACYDNNANTACDRNNILRLKSLLDAYNNSGDDVAIIDQDGTVIGHADPKESHQDANEAAGDCASK
ncbi:MAG: hypothetical protein HYZ18_03335 [Pseudogulbenkiania sp.]|nr:hypothetical protein [Pseudogulbenkiania sp.]